MLVNKYTKETFPYNNWYLTITEDNIEFICDWVVKKIPDYEDTWKSNNSAIIHNKYIKVAEKYPLGFCSDHNIMAHIEITFDDFKEFVLELIPLSTQPKPTNYKYLIPLLINC